MPPREIATVSTASTFPESLFSGIAVAFTLSSRRSSDRGVRLSAARSGCCVDQRLIASRAGNIAICPDQALRIKGSGSLTAAARIRAAVRGRPATL